MINVEYPRRGFVVEEVTQPCNTEGCTAKKFLVNSWEYYGEDTFNDFTEGMTVGQTTTDFEDEGQCNKCGKPVDFKRHFVITSDANALKTPQEVFLYARDILKAPFPEGEKIIATSAEYSFLYARDILKAPFPEGEKAIATDAHMVNAYKELFPEPKINNPIKEKKWDVFMETGISVSLPEYVNPETPEGNEIFRKAVINKFKEILDKNQVDFQWEEFE